MGGGSSGRVYYLILVFLCRYLSEERCEVQVWASKTAHSVRPVAGDVLVGSVYIQLSQLLSPGGTIRYGRCGCGGVASLRKYIHPVDGTPSSSQELMTWDDKLCTCISVWSPLKGWGLCVGYRSW